MASRVVVAVVAVLLIGWLAVIDRDERLLEHGVAISGRAKSARDAARAEQAFRDARLLNPDSAPDVGRAFVYIGAGRRKRAVGTLEEVLRREPDNLTAWGLLFSVSRGVDPANERRALAQRKRLDPLSSRP